MLIMNKKKSSCILFGTQRCLSFPFDITSDDGLLLESVYSFKYLGPWIDPELSFKPHINYIVNIIYVDSAYV